MSFTPVLSLFGWSSGPFPVPVETTSAVARSRGQGRPTGRCGTRLPLGGGEHGRKVFEIETIGKLSRAQRAAGALSFLIIGLVHGRSAAAEDGRRNQIIGAAIDEAASRFGLPSSWIRIVMGQESGGRPQAVSVKGAMGLMQLMPSTWRDMSSELALGDDPFEPRANILAGSAYLRRMYDRYGAPGFLAAYNAGPARYERYLAGSASLPIETKNYVWRLAPRLTADGAPPVPIPVRDWRNSGLFVSPGANAAWRGVEP